MLRLVENDDFITMKTNDGSDTVNFVFESPIAISVTKEGVKFSNHGDNLSGSVVCRQNTTVDTPEEATIIEMNEPVSPSFSLRYLNSFTKATPLSNTVTLGMSSEFPVLVEYKIAKFGYMRFYLAPKMEEDED